MPLHVRFARVTQTEVLFPEYSEDTVVIEGEVTKAGILEAGMQSGKIAVVLIAEFGQKRVAMLQLSADQLDGLVHCVRGFKDQLSLSPSIRGEA